mmetsp:Transcript_97744/g.276609  ORF Transcript_97744/g.276609 Transcript_97744/m.276609 type:complete len:245 (+) Transcript_97744:421-1155(+)
MPSARGGVCGRGGVDGPGSGLLGAQRGPSSRTRMLGESGLSESSSPPGERGRRMLMRLGDTGGASSSSTDATDKACGSGAMSLPPLSSSTEALASSRVIRASSMAAAMAPAHIWPTSAVEPRCDTTDAPRLDVIVPANRWPGAGWVSATVSSKPVSAAGRGGCPEGLRSDCPARAAPGPVSAASASTSGLGSEPRRLRGRDGGRSAPAASSASSGGVGTCGLPASRGWSRSLESSRRRRHSGRR